MCRHYLTSIMHTLPLNEFGENVLCSGDVEEGI